jgi:hypothetical protein
MAVTRILLSPVIALGVACLIGGNDGWCGRRRWYELSSALAGGPSPGSSRRRPFAGHIDGHGRADRVSIRYAPK